MKNEQNTIETIYGMPTAVFNALDKKVQTAIIKANKETSAKSKETEAKEKDKEQRATEISQLNEVNKSIFQAVKMLKEAKINTIGKDGKETASTIVTREQVKNVIKVNGFNPVQLLGVANVGQIFDKLRNGNSYSINEVYRLCEKMHGQKLDTTLQTLQNEKASKLFNIAKLHRLGEISTADAIEQMIALTDAPIGEKKDGTKFSLLSKSFAGWLYVDMDRREQYKALNLYRWYPDLSTELQAKQAVKLAEKVKTFDKTLNIETVAKSLSSVDLYTVEALNAFKAGENVLKAFISKATAKGATAQKVA